MKKPPPGAPWSPAKYTARDVAAIQAIFAGNATPDQQRHGMGWIINNVCKAYDMSFDPDSERNTSFAEGKRYVANQIIKAHKINTEILKEKTDGRRDSNRND